MLNISILKKTTPTHTKVNSQQKTSTTCHSSSQGFFASLLIQFII